MTPKMLSDAVMRLVDLLAMNPAETREIDPRSWDRLRIYMPNDPYAENLEHELRRLRDVVGDEDAALIDAALAGNGNEIVPVRCACQETNGVLVCRAPAGAPGCRFDTVYNGNEKSRSENGAAKAVPSQSQSEVKP